MIATRSVKAVHRHEESAKAPAHGEPVNEGDRVLIASIDSFPASDPPGWIEVKASPRRETPEPGRRR